jgi:hypothetical protein
MRMHRSHPGYPCSLPNWGQAHTCGCTPRVSGTAPVKGLAGCSANRPSVRSVHTPGEAPCNCECGVGVCSAECACVILAHTPGEAHLYQGLKTALEELPDPLLSKYSRTARYALRMPCDVALSSLPGVLCRRVPASAWTEGEAVTTSPVSPSL